jgi:hypothetical protein
MIPIVLFASSDYRLFGISPSFAALAGLRGVLFALTVSALLITRRELEPKNWDRLLFAWCISIAIGVTIINISRPSAYTGNGVVDLVLVLSIYIGIPMTWRLQLCVSVLFTLSSLTVLLFLRDTTPMEKLALLLSFVVLNIIGIVFSRALNIVDRRRYLAYEHQQEAERLISLMEQLLPICASCKAVKQTEDEWEAIESFVQQQSGVDITHGLCPTCELKHYPEAVDD